MIKRLLSFCNVVDLINEKIARVVSYFLILLMLLVTYEVISRYVFNRPTSWTFETNSFIYTFLVLLAGAWVLSINGHINVDVIYNKFGIRTRAIMSMATSLIIFTYLVLAIWATWDAARESLLWGETSGSTFDPPLFPVKFILPVGAGLFLMQGIARFIRFFVQAVTGVEDMKGYAVARDQGEGK